MCINKLNDFYWYYAKNLRKHEKKLIKYQGFGEKSIIKFKHESGLEWKTVEKLLKSLKILDGLELRNHLRDIYSKNKSLFDDYNTYITHLGPIGKSGAFIVNQFLRCYPGKLRMIIPNSNSDLQKLPENSSVVFLDDFIGTGKQGLDYVKQVSPSLNSSIKPYLFTICGTQEGLDRINDFGSKFKISTELLFSKENEYLLDPKNKILEDGEKKQILDLHKLLRIDDQNKYQLGLSFAFYYSTPDNSLGILWSDNIKYSSNSDEKIWYGLIPREY